MEKFWIDKEYKLPNISILTNQILEKYINIF